MIHTVVSVSRHKVNTDTGYLLRFIANDGVGGTLTLGVLVMGISGSEVVPSNHESLSGGIGSTALPS